jgi:hypothetical protein
MLAAIGKNKIKKNPLFAMQRGAKKLGDIDVRSTPGWLF